MDRRALRRETTERRPRRSFKLMSEHLVFYLPDIFRIVWCDGSRDHSGLMVISILYISDRGLLRWSILHWIEDQCAFVDKEECHVWCELPRELGPVVEDHELKIHTAKRNGDHLYWIMGKEEGKFHFVMAKISAGETENQRGSIKVVRSEPIEHALKEGRVISDVNLIKGNHDHEWNCETGGLEYRISTYDLNGAYKYSPKVGDDNQYEDGVVEAPLFAACNSEFNFFVWKRRAVSIIKMGSERVKRMHSFFPEDLIEGETSSAVALNSVSDDLKIFNVCLFNYKTRRYCIKQFRVFGECTSRQFCSRHGNYFDKAGNRISHHLHTFAQEGGSHSEFVIHKKDLVRISGYFRNNRGFSDSDSKMTMLPVTQKQLELFHDVTCNCRVTDFGRYKVKDVIEVLGLLEYYMIEGAKEDLLGFLISSHEKMSKDDWKRLEMTITSMPRYCQHSRYAARVSETGRFPHAQGFVEWHA